MLLNSGKFPVLTKLDSFELELAKKTVKEYIAELMVLTKQEQEFLERFEAKEYNPQLLFEDSEIIDRIKTHPMALWEIRQCIIVYNNMMLLL